MKFEKKGIFLGVKVVVSEKNISSILYVRFQDGVYSLMLDAKPQIDTIINDIVDKYDLGIANMGTIFSYIDYEKLIYFRCYIWDCKDNILQDMIASLDENVQGYISCLFSTVQPNCRVDNIGFSMDMNSLCIVGEPPKATIGMKKETNFDDESTWEDKSIQEALNHSFVRLDENVIVRYLNFWANEWWYGPQNYGGFTRIGKYMTDTGYSDYEYDMSSLKTTSLWDENTLIDLEGNKDNGISIMCNLKNINFFRGMVDSDSIHSGISNDIEMLLNVEFETHEHYAGDLNLIALDELLPYLQEHQAQVSRQPEISAEVQNLQTDFVVFKCSQNVRFQLLVTESEESAKDFCERNGWQLTDENGFVWDLDYCEKLTESEE